NCGVPPHNCPGLAAQPPKNDERRNPALPSPVPEVLPAIPCPLAAAVGPRRQPARSARHARGPAVIGGAAERFGWNGGVIVG
ncbi:MAG: hypothetical protein ACRD2F_08825, partial [Terriglobales bacterium]